MSVRRFISSALLLIALAGCSGGGGGGESDAAAAQGGSVEPTESGSSSATYTPAALSTATSAHFSGSGNCTLCHSTDGKTALIDASGTTVDIGADWSATMMANSARDPFWRAMVSAEVAAQPALKTEIEAKCTTCHAPMAKTEAAKSGASFGIADLEAEDSRGELARDGVSCTVCHQIRPDNLGTAASWSGGFEIGDDRRIFGPYVDITPQPMTNQSGFTPVYGAHIKESRLCGTCHTLHTPVVDDATGRLTGAQFPEQMPYREWEASRYGRAEGQSCQGCHMPAAQGAVRITNRPDWLTTTHEPFGKHHFVGGNAFMLSLMKENGAKLGLAATPAAMDATLARTRESLRTRTATLQASASLANDRLTIPVTVTNLTGHKFPTGFPSRRAWLHLVVTDTTGRKVFESGAYGADGEIAGLDSSFEPHYDEITRADQVQIYEPVMRNTSGAVTYRLMTAAAYAKDNRLLPAGMDPQTNDPDIRPQGTATDANFTGGADTVTYRIDTAGSAAPFKIQVELLYQTVAPRFVAAMRGYSTTEVRSFGEMYDRANKVPERVAEAEVTASP